MIIHGSFVEKSLNKFEPVDNDRVMKIEERSKYIWIRRFKSNKQKELLYKKVYESEKWINDLSLKVEKLIDRNTITIHNVVPTNLSIMK